MMSFINIFNLTSVKFKYHWKSNSVNIIVPLNQPQFNHAYSVKSILLQVYYLAVFDLCCYILFIPDVLRIYNAKSSYINMVKWEKQWTYHMQKIYVLRRRWVLRYNSQKAAYSWSWLDWLCDTPIKQTYATVCDVYVVFRVVYNCKTSQQFCTLFMFCYPMAFQAEGVMSFASVHPSIRP